MVKRLLRKNDIVLLLPLIAVLALAAFVFTTENANAETIAEGKCGDNATWALDDQGVLTISGSGAMCDYNKNTNTAPWHGHRDQVEKIIISDGITRIGNYAFSYLEQLNEDVVIPDCIEEIGVGAFEGASIQTMVIPESVTSIGRFAFMKCTSLWSIDLGNKIETIPSGLFTDCYALEGMQIPESVTRIGSSAFVGTSIRNLTIPENVTQIDMWAFADCTSLQTVEIPQSVIQLGGKLFDGCTNLNTIVLRCVYPKQTTDAFYDFQGEIIYPANGWDEDKRNEWAPNATWIPGEDTTVTTIDEGQCGDNVHWSFNNIGVLTISGEGAMYNYSETGTKAPWYYAYRNQIRKVAISDGITHIGSYAFIDLNKIKEEVVLPNSIKTIGYNAFSGSSIPAVTISESVTAIGYSAFEDCPSLERVQIPESVTRIGPYAFYGCHSLQDIIIPERVTKIEEHAFDCCSSLQEIIIPKNVTTINKWAFANCRSLRTIEIPQKVTSIGSRVFTACSSLETIILRCAAPKETTDAFAGFKGFVYYPASDNSWNGEIRNKWAPNATWKDVNTIYYDAKGDTQIIQNGTETKTVVSGDEVQAVIEEIELVKPKHVVIKAKPAGATNNVLKSNTNLPANIAQTANKVGADFEVETVVGSIKLDNRSIDAAITEDTDSFELNIADKSNKSDILTVVHDTEFKTVKGSNETNIINLAGNADITVPKPQGSLASDVFVSTYLGSGSGEEALITSKGAKNISVRTPKLGRVKTTSRDFRNARVKVTKSFVYTGRNCTLNKSQIKITISGDKTPLKASFYKIKRYENHKKVGTAKVYVQGLSPYKGTKSGSFYINPKKPAIAKVTAGKKKITVKMKTKVSATGGTKYRVQYRIAGKGKWKYKTTTAQSITIKKLKKGKKYQVKVRAIKGSRISKTSATKKSGKVK